MRIVIHTYEELQALRTWSARRGLRQVILELPGEIDHIRKTEKMINNGLTACGCETAAIFLLVGIAGLLGFHFNAQRSFDFTELRLYFGLAGYLILLVVTGKLIGIAIAEWRLRAAIELFKKC